jgi:hypothetical protein
MAIPAAVHFESPEKSLDIERLFQAGDRGPKAPAGAKLFGTSLGCALLPGVLRWFGNRNRCPDRRRARPVSTSSNCRAPVSGDDVRFPAIQGSSPTTDRPSQEETGR